MILDDINYDLYFDKKEKKIPLTRFETTILLFFIQNQNKKIKLEEIINCIYGKNSFTNVYKDSFRSAIYRLNSKMYPYARIVVKSKIGYYLKENTYRFNMWKNAFFEIHEDEKELLKLYDKKKNLEKKIKTLENFLT